MSEYLAPTQEMQFVLEQIAGLDEIAKLPGYEEATPDTVQAILEEAGRFAAEALAPLNVVGDQQGARLVDGKVKEADGFAQAYADFVENGWASLSGSVDFEGQGLPKVVGTAVDEMWQTANLAFSLCPMLTHGAIDAIQHHGSDAQKALYLPRLISGEWTGTMNLTEPQAGSDLSVVRTKAVPNGDHYLISGQKIFITWGDHEMAENVVHLVLARTPEAPAGTRGISLFIVPKFMVDADGNLGERNDAYAVSLEHKMGIHASPTCVMSFGDNGGAVGYLVGEENKGLAYMFTMMNNARLNVGLQGVSISERAYQLASAYAQERVQGGVPIIQHPDVKRMLLLMKTQTEAGRILAYRAFAHMDFAERSDDAETRKRNQAWVDLLTPIVKAWTTEMAQEVTSLGVQVHGGMGFIEETGAAQYMRDARIIPIYEGTTGIQALDLIGRKTLRNGGEGMRMLIDAMSEESAQLKEAGLTDIASALDLGIDWTRVALDYVLKACGEDPAEAGSAATNYLYLLGVVCSMWQLAVAARQAKRVATDASVSSAKLASATFYAAHVLPRGYGYLQAMQAGKSVLDYA